MSENKVILGELAEADSIVIDGTKYPVKPIDGFAYQLLGQIKGDDVEAIEISYKVAARCLAPAMTFDQVFGTEEAVGLSAVQVGQVIEKAKAQAMKVEALASPNSAPASAKRNGKRSPAPATR